MKHTSRKVKFRALILSLLFPGLGFVVLRREVRGFLWSLAFAVSLEAFLVALIVRPGCFASWAVASFVLMLCIYLGAQLFLFSHLGYLKAVPPEKRDSIFREVLLALLRDDLEKAQENLEKILSLNVDDPDAHFHMGYLLSLKGDIPGARREFLRCLELDDSGKWCWEIERELERLKGA